VTRPILALITLASESRIPREPTGWLTAIVDSFESACLGSLIRSSVGGAADSTRIPAVPWNTGASKSPGPKQNAPDSPESWDVRSNSPPPKTAQRQSTRWRCWLEWPNRAMTLVIPEEPIPGVTAAFGTPVTTTVEPLHKPQEQRKLTLDDAEVMVAAGRPGHR
jgi:hypothetical protein